MLAAVLFALTGAMGAHWPKVGPDYKAPKTSVPDAFRQQADTGGTTVDPAVANWWATLNDPELTALIESAVKSNLDLKIATSRVIEARAARRITRAGLLPEVSSTNTVERLRSSIRTP